MGDDDVYRYFTLGVFMFRTYPIREFSILPYIQKDALSSSSFPPPHDPISPLALYIKEMDKRLTQVEAADRQIDTGKTNRYDTFMEETQEVLTHAEPQGCHPIHRIYVRGRGCRGRGPPMI